LQAAGVSGVEARGPVFDSSLTVAMAAAGGAGVALLPLRMFGRNWPKAACCSRSAPPLELGRYWLTRSRCVPAKRSASGCAAQWRQTAVCQ
jgi:LysR family transcriptional regulator of beta-lactamase